MIGVVDVVALPVVLNWCLSTKSNYGLVCLVRGVGAVSGDVPGDLPKNQLVIFD